MVIPQKLPGGMHEVQIIPGCMPSCMSLHEMHENAKPSPNQMARRPLPSLEILKSKGKPKMNSFEFNTD